MRGKLIRAFFLLLLFLLLTLLTQVGGIILLAALPVAGRLSRKFPTLPRLPSSLLTFFLLYFSFTLLLLPPLARLGGRTPLPIFHTSQQPLQPRSYFYVLTNRHYVTPELKEAALEIAGRYQDRHPDIRLAYLDANFPFLDGFPLIPHLSHDDGRKLDLSLVWKDAASGRSTTRVPSLLGYGRAAAPRKGEQDMPAECARRGNWPYSLLTKILADSQSEDYLLDEAATRDLLLEICRSPEVKKVFLEPHLKTRLGLGGESKIRFHGCHAVRHDDHIHLEI